MHIKDAHLWHIRTKHESKTSEIGQTGKTADKLWTKDFFSIALINLFVLSSGNMLIPTFPFYIKSFGGTELIVGIAGLPILHCFSNYATGCWLVAGP